MSNVVEYLGYKVLNLDYFEARKRVLSGSVLTISPNSYGLATKNRDLRKALKKADLLVLDGVYFGLGYFISTGKTIKKNQGPDIFYQELEMQNERGGRIFFLGSTDAILQRIQSRLKDEFPRIKVETMSPPYKDKFSDEDNVIIKNAIESFQPDVVMVGMTCPKQEIWIHNNIENYTGILFMAIGGVFDWYSGAVEELKPLWWKLRLGWLGRWLQRPELVKRNLPNVFIYLTHIFKRTLPDKP